MALLSRTKKNPMPTPVVIQTLEQADPDYAALVAKIGTLETRRAAIERDIDRARRGKSVTIRAVDTAATAEHAGRVAALVGGFAVEAIATAEKRITAAEHVANLRSELDAVMAALEILKPKVPPAKAAASAKIVAEVRPTYDAAIRRTALALASALAGHREMLRITGGLNDNGVLWSGHLAQPANISRGLGEGWDRETQPDRFIADAIRDGFVSNAEIEEARNVH